ncbi:copper chaperone [Massilia sp. UMI-21]|nr:copper chaperone [Massilia sp. UMI-21]
MVTRAVRALDPQARVDVSLKDRLAQVERAEAPAALAHATAAAGYPASEAAD